LTPRFRSLWQMLGVCPRPEPRRLIQRSLPGIVGPVPDEWLRPIEPGA